MAQPIAPDGGTNYGEHLLPGRLQELGGGLDSFPPLAEVRIGDFGATDAVAVSEALADDSVFEVSVREDDVIFAGLRGTLKTAWQEAKDTSNLDKALLGITLAGLGFEYGPGNEWLIGKVGKETLEYVSSIGSVWISAACTAGATALAAAIEQTFLGTIMARNLERFPRTMDALRDTKIVKSGFLINSTERSLPGKFVNTFTIGGASVNLEDSSTDPDFIVYENKTNEQEVDETDEELPETEATLETLSDSTYVPEVVAHNKGYKRALGSAAFVAAGVLLIGGALGASAQTAINHGHPEAAYRVAGWASNPLLWFGGYALFRYGSYKLHNWKQSRQTQQQVA